MLPVDNTGSFAVIMFCGMTVFNIFSESVNAGARCVVDNANLVKKVIFPLADFAPGPAAFDNHPEPGLVCPAFVRRSLGGFFPFLDNTAPALIPCP